MTDPEPLSLLEQVTRGIENVDPGDPEWDVDLDDRCRLLAKVDALAAAASRLKRDLEEDVAATIVHDDYEVDGITFVKGWSSGYDAWNGESKPDKAEARSRYGKLLLKGCRTQTIDGELGELDPSKILDHFEPKKTQKAAAAAGVDPKEGEYFTTGAGRATVKVVR